MTADDGIGGRRTGEHGGRTHVLTLDRSIVSREPRGRYARSAAERTSLRSLGRHAKQAVLFQLLPFHGTGLASAQRFDPALNTRHIAG